MSQLFCPKDECFRHPIVCIKICPKKKKKSCLEYKDKFNLILEAANDPDMIQKYGGPFSNIFNPLEITRRKTVDKPKVVAKNEQKKNVNKTKKEAKRGKSNGA